MTNGCDGMVHKNCNHLVNFWSIGPLNFGRSLRGTWYYCEVVQSDKRIRGFIAPENGGADVFVHISAVERAGMSSLREGQKISFEPVNGRNGKVSAENLRG